MKTDQELKITFKFEIEGDLLKLIYLLPPEDHDEDVRQAGLIYEDFTEIISQNPDKKFKLFVDVSQVSGWKYVAGESRKIYSKMVGHEQIVKVGVFGVNILFGVAGSLILKASGKSDALKFFNDKEIALAWLK